MISLLAKRLVVLFLKKDPRGAEPEPLLLAGVEAPRAGRGGSVNTAVLIHFFTSPDACAHADLSLYT